MSVIIPAHNEALVLPACLRAVGRAAASAREPVEIVVVANGCTDETAAVAARTDPTVRIIVLPGASKHAALSAGSAAATGTTEIYLDADVVLSDNALGELAVLLSRPDAMVAAPVAKLDLSEVAPWLRGYYRAWMSRPWWLDNPVGSGCYALNAAARARFDMFPPLVADDLFIRKLFASRERALAQGATMTIRPPRDLSHLLAVRTRVRAGNLEYAQWSRGRPDFNGSVMPRPQRRQRQGVRQLGGAASYAAVNLVAEIRARQRLARGTASIWGHDVRRETP